MEKGNDAKRRVQSLVQCARVNLEGAGPCWIESAAGPGCHAEGCKAMWYVAAQQSGVGPACPAGAGWKGAELFGMLLHSSKVPGVFATWGEL